MLKLRLERWLLVAAVFLSARAAMGQSSSTPTHLGDVKRIFALVAVPDTFRYLNTDAVIVRRKATLPHDLILVRPGHADARMIAEAVQTLQAERARHGDVPATNRLVRVRTPRAALRLLQHAASWAEALNKKPSVDVAGIGSARAIGLLLRNDQVTVRDRQ